MGLISKNNFARAAHFFVHFFAVVWHDYNVKLLWRKCHTCSRSVFFTAAHLHLALVAASISHLTAATKFSCCSSNKKCLLCFLSLVLDLCCPFLIELSLACRPFSLFLCLSPALYSKFVDMTIYLRESSFNMTRGGEMKILRGGSENLYTSKPTHDIIIQIGWFSTQQFNDLCNSAISRGLQI